MLSDLVKGIDDHRVRTARKAPPKTTGVGNATTKLAASSSAGPASVPKQDKLMDLYKEDGDSAHNAGSSTVSPSPPPASRTTSSPHHHRHRQQQLRNTSTGKRGPGAMAASNAAGG
mmetsp:Transcript_28841/g.83687  ORF Transcript_28841/g.83687 Transcript_28841/m.83687 type:complete len:116 (-) Transcript_28841:801-1148(-)